MPHGRAETRRVRLAGAVSALRQPSEWTVSAREGAALADV